MRAPPPVEIEIASSAVPGARIVTPPARLIDRMRLECEVVALQPRRTVGGRMTLTHGDITAHPPQAKRRLLPRRARVETAPGGRWIADLRHNQPRNWAHVLNNHLPVFFRMAEIPGFDIATALALIPEDAPGFVARAAGLFGLETWATDAVVEGRGVAYAADPWMAIRAIRADWAHLDAPQQALARSLAASDRPLPSRPFLARRDTRLLKNQTEIEAILGARGFQTVYAEDLSAIEQMRLFREADEIVAVHGAALAPLLYTGRGQGGPARVIELFPVGHMTDVYRVIAADIGCDWIGVRGRIEAAHLPGIYAPDKPFVAHSLDPFEIDPVSLELAFDLVKET